VDHAEAHEWLDDLALEPRRLALLDDDGSPAASAFRTHAAGCETCLADLQAWQRTHVSVAEAAGPGADAFAPVVDPALALPAWLRDRVAAIPRANPQPGVRPGERAGAPAPASRRRGVSRLGLLAAAVAAAVVIGVGAVAVDQARRMDAVQRELVELASMNASLTRILAEPDHVAVSLSGLDGAPAGAVAWTPLEIVVASTALAPPPEGMEYRCWIERDGARTLIGAMHVEGGLAYWSGPISAYERLDLGPGGVLGVSLEAVGRPGGNAPVIAGALPG
jgi:hypothetical protein